MPANELANKLSQLLKNKHALELVIITSRGLKIWPDSMIEAPYLRHCCCRFQSSADVKNLKPVDHDDIFRLLQEINEAGLDIVKMESLYTFDGELGFTLAQGQ